MTIAQDVIEYVADTCGDVMDLTESACLNSPELVSNFNTRQGRESVQVFVFSDGSSINVFDDRIETALP